MTTPMFRIEFSYDPDHPERCIAWRLFNDVDSVILGHICDSRLGYTMFELTQEIQIAIHGYRRRHGLEAPE